MRNISFMLTAEQFTNGTKDVTRRLRWLNLKPGDRLCGVLKSQGLKKGEKLHRLGVIEVVSKRRERLDAITGYEVHREGFPLMTPAQFISMFCSHMKCEPSTIVTRIEFTHIEPENK